MNKKLITIIISLLVAAGLIAVLFFLNKEPEAPAAGTDSSSQSQALPELSYFLGGSQGLEVEKIQIDHAEESISISAAKNSQNNPIYTIEGFEGLPVVQSKIAPLFGNASKMYSSTVIENADFSQFGLDKPQAVVKISSTEGERQLLIGSLAPGESNYYVTLDGDKNAYVVSSSKISPFLLPKMDYLDKTITLPLSGEETVKEMILGGYSRENEITVIEAQGQDSRIYTHVIKSDRLKMADTEAFGAIYASAFGLNALEIASLVSDSDTLEKYGLAQPYSKITLTGEGFTGFTLSASEADSESNVYVKLNSSKFIYKVNKIDLPWLETTEFDLIGKLAVLPFIDDVATVKLKGEDKEYVFKLSGSGDDFVAEANGKALDTADFRQFYQLLLSAKYDSVPGEEMTGQEAELFSISYFYRDGRPADIVRFYSGPPRRAYIVLNDGEAYLCQSSYIDKLIEEADKISG